MLGYLAPHWLYTASHKVQPWAVVVISLHQSLEIHQSTVRACQAQPITPCDVLMERGYSAWRLEGFAPQSS
jgi:hypothetical protein